MTVPVFLTAALFLAPPPPPASPITSLLMTGAAITAAVDLTVSAYHLGAGTVRELNPLLRPWQDAPVRFGLIKASLTAGQLWLIHRLRRHHPRIAQITAAVLIGVNTWAVIHNTRAAR